MIYEMRTYTLKPGSVAEFEKRWAPMVEARQKLSPLAGLWHTEVGPLNEMIHIWPYESVEERNRIRAQAVEQGIWPPNTRDLIVKQRSEILTPAPFMRPMEPRQLGNIYEMRIYTYQTGAIPEVIKRWSEALPHREKFSPLAACWYSEFGELNRWIHLWPYESMAERDRIRAEAVKDGRWPANTREWMVSQETKILVPAAFSPMR
jgi:hypothetical protein